MNKSKKHWFLKVFIIFILCSCILIGYKIYRPIPDTVTSSGQELNIQQRINLSDGLTVNLTSQELTSYINEALAKKEENFKVNIQKEVIIDGKQNFIGRPLDYQLKLIPTLNDKNELILSPSSLYIGAVKVPTFMIKLLLNNLQIKLPDFMRIEQEKIIVDVSKIDLSPYFNLTLTELNLDKNTISVRVNLKGITTNE